MTFCYFLGDVYLGNELTIIIGWKFKSLKLELVCLFCVEKLSINDLNSKIIIKTKK